MEAALIKAPTGLKFDPADLFLIGERIVKIEKAAHGGMSRLFMKKEKTLEV